MAWIEVLERENAQGQLSEIYDEVSRKRGGIANVYKIHSMNPPTLKAHLELYMSLLYRKGGLSRAQREMIAVTVSALDECEYCVVHHSEALARYVKSTETLKSLRQDYRETDLPEKERAMLDYCAKLTMDPYKMRERDVEELRTTGFTDSEILDINLITSYFNFVNRVVLGLGVELEADRERDYRY